MSGKFANYAINTPEGPIGINLYYTPWSSVPPGQTTSSVGFTVTTALSLGARSYGQGTLFAQLVPSTPPIAFASANSGGIGALSVATSPLASVAPQEAGHGALSGSSFGVRRTTSKSASHGSLSAVAASQSGTKSPLPRTLPFSL